MSVNEVHVEKIIMSFLCTEDNKQVSSCRKENTCCEISDQKQETGEVFQGQALLKMFALPVISLF